MGNALACVSRKEMKGGMGSRSKRNPRPIRKMDAEEEQLHQLAMAIHQHQLSQRFEGSMSRRLGSASSRRGTLSDSFSNVKQDPVFLESIEVKKLVLVHGEGFGAWCWYKTVALLEESGMQPIALDLTGSGTNNTDPNNILSLADYSKPLIDFLCSIPEDEKVILVGHSCGGASISYALEHHPQKISKAVYLCATMVLDGQRPFDVFADELASADIFMQESQLLVYSKGRENPPTTLKFDKQQIRALYFNQSPCKDIALAHLSMKPIPLPPIMEKLCLTPENYGSVPRYFIQTLEDHMLSPDAQEKLIRDNPPQRVYKIKGSDHCPFFSKPQSLHKILLEVAQDP